MQGISYFALKSIQLIIIIRDAQTKVVKKGIRKKLSHFSLRVYSEIEKRAQEINDNFTDPYCFDQEGKSTHFYTALLF